MQRVHNSRKNIKLILNVQGCFLFNCYLIRIVAVLAPTLIHPRPQKRSYGEQEQPGHTGDRVGPRNLRRRRGRGLRREHQELLQELRVRLLYR